MWFGVRDLMLSRLMTGGQVFDHPPRRHPASACTGSGTCGMCTNSHTGIPCSVCTWCNADAFRQVTPIEALAEKPNCSSSFSWPPSKHRNRCCRRLRSRNRSRNWTKWKLRLKAALDELKKQRAKFENKVP